MGESKPSFISHERLPESDIERKQTLEELDRAEVACEAAILGWTENLRTLEQQIPHNDVLQDEKTMSYDVAYNLILAKVNQALEAQKDIKFLRSELSALE